MGEGTQNLNWREEVEESKLEDLNWTSKEK